MMLSNVDLEDNFPNVFPPNATSHAGQGSNYDRPSGIDAALHDVEPFEPGFEIMWPALMMAGVLAASVPAFVANEAARVSVTSF